MEVKTLEKEELLALPSHYELLFANPAWKDLENVIIMRMELLREDLEQPTNTREEDMEIKGQIKMCKFIQAFKDMTEQEFQLKQSKGEEA